MTTVYEETEVILIEPEPPRLAWGWFLAAGIAWFVIGLAFLTWSPATVSLIAVGVGTFLLLAGAMEIVMAFVMPGWKWLHGIVGLFFLVTGILAFTNPFRTFASLAMLFGWYFLFKGMVVLIVSLATRVPGSLWGFGVFVGAIDIAIGLWAIGYPGRSAWLMVLWIGIGAIMHGVGDIVTAFRVRSDS